MIADSNTIFLAVDDIAETINLIETEEPGFKLPPSLMREVCYYIVYNLESVHSSINLYGGNTTTGWAMFLQRNQEEIFSELPPKKLLEFMADKLYKKIEIYNGKTKE